MPRQTCQQCGLVKIACVCRFLHPQFNHLPIIIIQHPDEVSKTLGTAKLIKLGLKQVECLQTISLAKKEFSSVLDAFGASSPYVLHQEAREGRGDWGLDCLAPRSRSKTPCDALVLLDGTFRNVREILLANSWLATLPRLVLKNAGTSDYRLRKSQIKNGLSSIEAVAKALSLLDESFRPDALLLPFEKMIDFQIQKMGYETYAKNYL